MQEIYKDIEGYEGMYQVSNMGNVRSLPRNTTKGKVLNPGKNTYGYLHVALCKDGKSKHYQVHRLVATAFLPNPENLPQVNHKDENPLNNNLSNIEWCSVKYNINYGSRNQRASEANSIPVGQYTKDRKLIAIYCGAREASRQTGIASQHITACCKGRLKSAGNFIWKYA